MRHIRSVTFTWTIQRDARIVSDKVSTIIQNEEWCGLPTPIFRSVTLQVCSQVDIQAAKIGRRDKQPLPAAASRRVYDDGNSSTIAATNSGQFGAVSHAEGRTIANRTARTLASSVPEPNLPRQHNSPHTSDTPAFSAACPCVPVPPLTSHARCTSSAFCALAQSFSIRSSLISDAAAQRGGADGLGDIERIDRDHPSALPQIIIAGAGIEQADGPAIVLHVERQRIIGGCSSPWRRRSRTLRSEKGICA